MKVKARNYLFFVRRNQVNERMNCRNCDTKLTLGDLIYSKRKQKYYCIKRTIKFGHLTEKFIEKFIEVKSK